MRRILKELIPAFFDPLVVVTMMTTLSLVISILAFVLASPSSSGTISRKIKGLCLLIGVIGLITIILQMRFILQRKYARERLAELYREGREVMMMATLVGSSQDSLDRLSSWRRDTKEFLLRYLDVSYVIRFEAAGVSAADVLLDFLKEMKA